MQSDVNATVGTSIGFWLECVLLRRRTCLLRRNACFVVGRCVFCRSVCYCLIFCLGRSVHCSLQECDL